MSDPAVPLSTPSGPASGTRVLFRIGSFRVTLRGLLKGGLGVVVLAAVGVIWGRLDMDELHARARALPAVAVVVAMVLLPLAGFPVSWLHVVAGVRFGFMGGIGVVALTSVLHHVLGWGLVRVLPTRWFERLAPWRRQLAGAGHRDATLLCCLMPGMPYSAQLYLLPLIGTPFGLMFGLSSLLHTGRAVVTILFGDLSDELTPAKLTGLAAYYAVLITVSTLAVRRLRRALANSGSESPRCPGDS